MNKKILSLVTILVFFSGFLFAQIPAGYYDDAEGKTGDELKEALYTIIKGHTEISYGDARYILDETDADPNNPENVRVIYSNHSVSGEWDSGVTWNREHVWAKVHGIGGVTNSTKGCGSDIHNLRACISSINNNGRNSRFFGECTEPYVYNGENTGSYTSSTDWVWKPRDEDKGDAARIIFYMAARYEGENGEPDLELIDYIPSDNNSPEPLFGVLSDLLAWNEQDPVDDFEVNRNEIIYDYQNNRNPFIDHPEYVNLIWSTTSVSQHSLNNFSVYPNPAKNLVYISGIKNLESVSIFNILGKELKKVAEYENGIDTSDLPRGSYIVVVNKNGLKRAQPLVILN